MSREKTALFESWRGRYADSPRAISETLRVRHPDLRQIWVADRDTALPDGTKRVRRHSPEYFTRLFSADFLISNDVVSKHLVKGPRLTYLQTWHGTPLKTIGHDEVTPKYDAASHRRRMDRDVAKWDLLLSTGAECSEMFRSAFGFEGTILETGLPRNDVLCSAEGPAIGRRTREELGIEPDARVVLWAPTWRDDIPDGAGGFGHPGGLDTERFIDRCDRDVVLLVRMHSVVSSRLNAGRTARLIDVSDHPEIADLYLASDLLVSDYSSTVYDFAVTGKPIVLLAHDLHHYQHGVRRLYLDYETWAPGPIVTDTDALVDAVHELSSVNGDDLTWRDRRAEFVRRFCAHEDGGATDRVIDAVFSPRLDH